MGLFKDVASVVSPIIGSAADLWGGTKANKLAASNAQANRDFQEYMASNAHQLEVEDLKKAGLNPILSANAGATASGGANAAFVNPAQGVSSGLNSAAMLLQQQNLVKAQTDQMRSLAYKNASDASVAQATLPLMAEQIKTNRTQQQANSAVAAYNTAQLGVLPAIIQREMATAAREISQAGLNSTASDLNRQSYRYYEPRTRQREGSFTFEEFMRNPLFYLGRNLDDLTSFLPFKGGSK